MFHQKFSKNITQPKHAQEVQSSHVESMPSKYPGKYRIDLHIDDDRSVAANGKVYGFRVFIVGGQDDDWANKIIDEIEKNRKNRKAR